MPEPQAGDQVAGVADEPGVAEILAGSGFAGCGPTGKLRLLSGPAYERLSQHRVHHAHVAGIDDAAEILRGVRKQHLAIARAHALYHMGVDGVPAVGEWRIGGDELQERDFCAPESE